MSGFTELLSLKIADGRITDTAVKPDRVTLVIEMWDSTPVKLVFKDWLHFELIPSNELTGFRIIEDSELLKGAVGKKFPQPDILQMELAQFRHVHLYQRDSDAPVMSLIASNVFIYSQMA